MIRKLHLKAFKCFLDLKLLFAPITLLTGLNSSGKSTTLQAIRLCKDQQMLKGLGTVRDLRCALSSAYPEINVEFTDGSTASCTFAESGLLSHDTHEAFSRVYYISADRLGPRVSLPYTDKAVHVGETGESVYALLARYRDKGGVPEPLRHESLPDTSSLFEQVRAWLSLIAPGCAFDFQIHADADIGTGAFAGFRPTNVGFGLSYTLPILVSVLVNAARVATGELSDSVTLLLENPEAHLHPRGQTQLGYFLALASQCGVQCVVETHSEHILNGIRIAVKEGRVPDDKAIFHYFTKNPQTETSEVTSIFTDPNGMLDNWPDGFFDEAEHALMRLL